MNRSDLPLQERIKGYENCEGMRTLPANAKLLYCEVLDGMQNAEEIWGVEGADYVALMTAISAEALKRIRVSQENESERLLKDLGKDDVIEFLENNNTHLKATILAVDGNLLHIETEHGDKIRIINSAVTYRIQRRS